jgi:hypothetical protein
MKQTANKGRHPHKEGLVIKPGTDTPLSRTQAEFNRLLKSLETTRARYAREQARLDDALATSIRELMPMIEELNQIDRDFIFAGHKALQTVKFSEKRRHFFTDIVCGKVADLLEDPVGLGEEDQNRLKAILDELDPEPEESHSPEERGDDEKEEFDFLREMMVNIARQAGVDLDLTDIDPSMDPQEFERVMQERINAATAANPAVAKKSSRKPTKAQLEKARKRLELESAKNRDLKSLFKQLAKAFHPDLETDPLLKVHKEVWMKRLNTAYAANDLREMLQLEMEWLGEESTNLATAGDAKLKVYCMVLKEQIEDLKRQTHFLPNEPQYGPLQRFRNPYYGTIAKPESIKRELRQELEIQRHTLEILAANNAGSRQLIYRMADSHGRRPTFTF